MRSFAFAKFRKTLFVVCVLIVASCIVTKANAATEAELTISEKVENFPIIEGQTWENFTFLLEETSKEFAANVKILASDLRDEKRGLRISANAITFLLADGTDASKYFVLNKSDTISITVSVKTEDVKAGSYQGRIIANAENATNAELSLAIQVSWPFLWAALVDLGGILFGVAMTIAGVAIKKPQKGLKGLWDEIKEIYKKYKWTIFGATVLMIALYLSSLLALYPTITDFGADGIIDIITAVFFGLGQYGGSSAAATIGKAVEDRRRR